MQFQGLSLSILDIASLFYMPKHTMHVEIYYKTSLCIQQNIQGPKTLIAWYSILASKSKQNIKPITRYSKKKTTHIISHEFCCNYSCTLYVQYCGVDGEYVGIQPIVILIFLNVNSLDRL